MGHVGRGGRSLRIPSTLGRASGPVPSAVLAELGADSTQRMAEDKARPARGTRWGGSLLAPRGSGTFPTAPLPAPQHLPFGGERWGRPPEARHHQSLTHKV